MMRNVVSLMNKKENEPLITVENLSKIYQDDKNNKIHAVNSLNLEIYKGEIFGLVGESGCGKTTFGEMLLKLTEPSEGKIYYDFENAKIDLSKTKGTALKELRKRIQIVFQDPYSSINPRKTIGWLLEEPLIIHKIDSTSKEREKIIDEMLGLVGLDKTYKKRLPHELSGGQRQRIAIAIALILNPSFVVCDEAVSSLDMSIQAQILNLLKDLQEKFNLTYLFIAHNLNVVGYMADRIAVMNFGEIVELGDANLLCKTPLHPYTEALFSSLTNISEEEKPRIILDGELPSRTKVPKGCVFASRCKYATEKCIKEKPILKEMSDGRQIACHKFSK